MLLSETRDDRTFSIYHNTVSGGHEVNPYKIVKDPLNPTGFWVYVYDNDYPDSTNQRFFIDTVANTWSYASLPRWGGARGLFLSLPVSSNLTPPILPAHFRPEKSPTAEAQIGNANIDFYNSTDASILITDSFGNTIGYADSIAFSNIPNGIPTIPKTGRFHPPIGYYLPEGEYSVRMSEFSDSLIHFYAFADSLIYGFERSGTHATQTDYLRMGNALSFRNPDQITKTIRLSTILVEDTSSEKAYYIDDMAVAQGDSLRMRAQNYRNLTLTNVGGAKTYDLRLTLASTAGQSNFAHADVVLDSTSTHFIVPVWDSLRTRLVRILIDRGNNGTIDDSVFIVNQATDVDQMPVALPQEYRLEQNYPNPFNAATVIQYAIPIQGHVTLKIYDLLGREVATLVNQTQQRGAYSVEWDAGRLSSGVYFCRMQAQGFSDVKKIVLMR
jgi:hypothetical protein